MVERSIVVAAETPSKIAGQCDHVEVFTGLSSSQQLCPIQGSLMHGSGA